MRCAGNMANLGGGGIGSGGNGSPIVFLVTPRPIEACLIKREAWATRQQQKVTSKGRGAVGGWDGVGGRYGGDTSCGRMRRKNKILVRERAWGGAGAGPFLPAWRSSLRDKRHGWGGGRGLGTAVQWGLLYSAGCLVRVADTIV